MDTIKFIKNKYEFGWAPPGGVPCIEIFVNDVPLLNIISEYAKKNMVKSENKKLGSDYAYNYPDILYFQLINAESYRLNNNYFNAMICTCGEAGCSSFDMEIEELPDVIIWKNGIDRRRAVSKSPCHINYSKFPFFRFHKAEYMKAIDELRSFTLSKD